MDDVRAQRIEELKSRYFDRLNLPSNLTSERLTIRQNLDRLHSLVEPPRIPRVSQGTGPIVVQDDRAQEELGRFRDHDLDRKSITADMDVIRFYRDLGQEPPSFVEAGPRKELYFDPKEVRVGILTAGGIAPGLNTVVESIVDRHCETYGLRSGPHGRGLILGFQDGFKGLENDCCEELNPDKVQGWCRLGASRLGVGRGSKDVDRWLEKVKTHDLDILYVIGGNGSLTGAWHLAQRALTQGINLAVGVVPKTMDNDILWIWQSFGFASAFEKATEVIQVLHTEAESNRRVGVIQFFGADSGHVAANAALGSGEVDAVLIPEQEFEVAELCNHIKQRVDRNKHAIVVMAEGARGIEHVGGKWVRWKAENRQQRDRNYESLKTALGQALKAAHLDHEVFGNQPQHFIRSVVPNSSDQVYCRRLADMVVDSCLAGYTGFMISSWLTEYVLVPLQFPARGGLTKDGAKTFPTGGIFWRTVTRSTGQPSFLTDEVKKRLLAGEIADSE